MILLLLLENFSCRVKAVVSELPDAWRLHEAVVSVSPDLWMLHRGCLFRTT